jgi:hypothetical protein
VLENNALEYSNVPKTVEKSGIVEVKGKAANKAIK